jgi:trehalose 2-sulfotransferase
MSDFRRGDEIVRLGILDLVPRITRSYLVCATPRSGSTLLCEALKATGVAGRPEEYFEAVPATGARRRPQDYLAGLDDPEALALVCGDVPDEQPAYSSLRGVKRYADHLARVREWGTTANGVFGAKIMWRQVADLATFAAEGAGGNRIRGRPYADLLATLFDDPRYVWVRRRDTVRQAVSLWRAMQTQFWRANEEPPVSRPGAPEPRYSFAALHHLARMLRDDDAAWERFFTARRHPVLVLTYEELAADLLGMVRRTLGHLGVAPPEGPLAAPRQMRRQSDELSERWVETYARDAAARLTSPTR